MKRILFIILLIGMITACSSMDAAQEQTLNANGEPVEVAQVSTPTPIPTVAAADRTTFTVQRGTVSEDYLFRARWLPRDQIVLAFEVGGNVRSVNVQRGDTVAVGDVIADLQIDDLEATLASQQISLDAAIRNLNESSSTSDDGVVSAQFTLASQNLNLESQELGLPWTSVNNAWANVEAAQRSVENAERDYNDALSYPDTPASEVNNLRESLISSQESLDRAWNDYYSASANYRQSEISVIQQENSVLQAELALEDAQTSGGDPDLVDSVAQAQLNVDRTLEQIEQSTLISPIDGVVLEVTIQPGDGVSAYVAVITLAIPQPLEAIANLAFTDTQLLQIGQIGICEETNNPNSRVQCVIRQLPLSSNDVDQTVRVAATLPDLVSGSLIDVTMTLSESLDTLWLPPEAINIFNNRTFVVVLTDEGERVQDVTIGLETDERVEILSGVEAGDVVVQQ